MEYTKIQFEKSRDVAIIRLIDRSVLNAMDLTMTNEVVATIETQAARRARS